jgi:hypothetical protein
LASPAYSARKHHVPSAVAVNAAEVAEPLVNVTAPPSAVPPAAQSLVLVSGPQVRKLTVPVGVPPVAFPVTVALSVFESPRVIVGTVGVVEVFEIAGVTAKHSVPRPSEDKA